MPAGVRALSELGLDRIALARGARPFQGIMYATPGLRTVRGRFPGAQAGTCGLALPRPVLDGMLREALGSSPRVKLLEGITVQEVWTRGDRVQGVRAREGGSGREVTVEADLTVAADGLGSHFHRLPGVRVVRPKRPRFGLKVHLADIEGLGECVEVHLIEGGEVYLAPQGETEAVAALLLEERRLPRGAELGGFVRHALVQAPLLAGRTARVRLLDRPRLKGPLGLEVRAGTIGEGYMLAGDAAGALDPVTGEGMSLAFCGASILGRLVLEGGLTRETCRRAALGRARLEGILRRLTGGVMCLSRSHVLAEAAVVLLARMPGMFSRLLGVAAGR
jgi:2-polyprenyl-6-methoxyphenol hydroxylase-like FAD-dependent oxidoreductase